MRLSFSRLILVLGIPLAVFLTMLGIVGSIYFQENPQLMSFAITIDMLIVIPLTHFFLVRKTRIPTITIVPLFILTIILTGFLLPEEYQQTLSVFKIWILPVVELTIFTLVVFKIRKMIGFFKDHQQLDFFSNLKLAVSEVLPKSVVVPFSMEIAVIYYGLVRWKKRSLSEAEFTCHKESGTQALLFAIILIVLVELFAIHLLLVNRFPIFAWTLTILSAYSGLQLLAFGKSLSQRPYVFQEDGLFMPYGLLSEIKIDYENIAAIEISSKEVAEEGNCRKLSPLGKLDSHNVVLQLKQDQEMLAFYGIRRKVKTLLIWVDDKEGFVRNVNEKMIEQGQ